MGADYATVYICLGPREGHKAAVQKESGGVSCDFLWYAWEATRRLLVMQEPELRGGARDQGSSLTL